MNKMNPKVEFYFKKAKQWQEEYEKLREIILDCSLAEELKWGCPCYTFQKSNIVLIHGFKEYCALLFFKGALLKDANGILVQQTKNVQAARQIRFTNVREIVQMEPVLKEYIEEATEVEKAGLKVEYKKNPEAIPEEFQVKLNAIQALKAAFAKLTPGRQRAYILYFSAAKQSKTRESRVEKCIEADSRWQGIGRLVRVRIVRFTTGPIASARLNYPHGNQTRRLASFRQRAGGILHRHRSHRSAFRCRQSLAQWSV